MNMYQRDWESPFRYRLSRKLRHRILLQCINGS